MDALGSSSCAFSQSPPTGRVRAYTWLGSSKRIHAAVALPGGSTATRGGESWNAVSRSVPGRQDLSVAASATAAVKPHTKRASATRRRRRAAGLGARMDRPSLFGVVVPYKSSERPGMARRNGAPFAPPPGCVPSNPPMARIVLRLLTLLALGCALVAAPPASAAGPDATANSLSRAMRSAGSASGAIAVDLDTGRTLYQLRPDTARIPASVEKLYTTSTALLRLGPEETLSTAVLGEAPIAEDGTLTGNLFLRGGGDPTFGTS